MRAFLAVPTLRASLATALGLTSAACTSGGGESTFGTVHDGGGDATLGTVHDAGGDSMLGTHDLACVDPVPILVSGKDTGYDTCQGGTVRRRAIIECPTAPPPPSTCDPDASGFSPCSSNGDCDAGLFGFCNGGPYGDSCSCQYGCTRDSDCASGQICLCRNPVGACVFASCNAGTCGAGEECASYWMTYCTGCIAGFACQTAADTCFSDLDCDGGVCSLGTTGRECSYGNGGSCCGFGRPFLVDDRARVASVVERPDWREPIAPEVASLSPSVRSRLARHWTEAARMEHASIAAFARFALQLLTLGAPPDLVVDAQRAMVDETRHARLAFGLASAYAGADIGPGRLAVRGSLEATDLRSVLATTFVEGCIGETVAALEATEALEHLRDRDPAVAAILATIAADEARHAELAWRSVAWMVSAFGQAARDALDHALRGALADQVLRSPGAGDPETSDRSGSILERGVLAESARAAIRREALGGVVVPLARALLAGPEGRAQERPRA
jgi:hypothetical protein